MKKLFATALAVSAFCVPVLAQPQVIPNTLDAMGCMKLGECTEGVIPIDSVDVLEEYYPGVSFARVRDEATEIIDGLKASNIQVYLGDQQYFPRTHRGSYYTDTNTFYLNSAHMLDPDVFIKVLRHEGWHAAQDCMAGGLNNSFIAVIHDDVKIPQRWKIDAEIRYGMIARGSIPWEQEAIWAGNTPDMTAEALGVCGATDMWDVYQPTPMTSEWLQNNGHL